MAIIKGEDLFDKSVEAAIDKLVEAEKNLITVTKQLTESAKELKKAYDDTGIKDLTNLNKQYEAQIKASYTIEKNAIELDKQREKLSQEKIRTKKTLNDQATKEAQLAAKNAIEAEKLASAYLKESKQLNELRKNAKDTAITHGLMSKEFKTAQAEVLKLDSKLKKIDSALGQNQRNVGNYGAAFGSVKNVLGQFGIVLSGVTLATNAFNKTISSTQIAGDKWAEIMGSMEAATSRFFQMVATGDFSNFINRINQASEAGANYARGLDDLFEGSKALQIAEAEAALKIAEAEVERDKVTNSRTKRMEKAYEINAEELKLLELRKAEAIKSYKVESGYITDLTGLKEDELISFLRGYRTQEDLREKAIASIAEEKRLNENLRKEKETGTWVYENGAARQVKSASAAKKAEEDLATFMAQRPKDVQTYIDIYKKYGTSADKQVTKTIDAYTKMTDVQKQYFEDTRRNEVKLSKMIKQIRGEEEEDAGDNFKAKPFEAKIEKAPELSPYIQRLAEESEANKSFLDLNNEETFKAMDEEIQMEAEQAAKKIELDKQTNEKRLELEQELVDKKKEINNQAYELTKELFNAAFESRKEELQEESEAITAEYDARLQNEELTDEQRAALEAKRDKRLNENKRKQRELEKKQFLMNQAFKVGEVVMDTAQKIAAIKATANLLGSNPITKALEPLALAQIPLTKISSALSIATILAQSIPKFDLGTNYTPDMFWAGEKRPEFVKKAGKTMFVDKPTLFSGQEWRGSQVVSGAETEKILRSENLKGIMEGGKKSDNGAMMLTALHGIKHEISKQRMSVSVNAGTDIKTTLWYKNIRN